ncbi:MAG: DUF4956 domain-containing protein [Clostridia bacterium]|nr:DUF4956 domain-containing protein [Clostridia bacterium]
MLSILEKSFLEGYATSDLDVTTMFLCIGFTAAIALYICLVYKMVNKNKFFDRSFHLSLFALAVITAAIILTIQSNIVISLGMVGALSIVRFRTAIKNPMDLVFLFWSISIGIICGAGFAMISVIASIVLTIGIVLFSIVPAEKESLILVVNSSANIEEQITDVVSKDCVSWKVRARNVDGNNVNLAIEVKTSEPQALMDDICKLDGVTSASLIEHDGDVTA